MDIEYSQNVSQPVLENVTEVFGTFYETGCTAFYAKRLSRPLEGVSFCRPIFRVMRL